MAAREEPGLPSRILSPQKLPRYSRLTRLFLPIGAFLLGGSTAFAQTSTQQYVYTSVPGSSSSAVSGFSKASATGALSQVPGSPFNERLEGGLAAIDGQGKFLFVLNPKSNDISMFQIDQASGALSEVAGSPFAVPPTINPSQAPSQPLSISGESSGKFLFVGYFSGDFQGQSAVVSLTIDTSGPTPALLTQQTMPTASGGAPAQLLTDPKGLHLYVGLTTGQNGVVVGGAEVYSIDSSTGKLAYQGMADTLPGSGQVYAIDPRDRFLFAGGHGNVGFLENCIISPVDGTANTCSPVLFLGSQNFPTAMVAENSGQFLYVYQSGSAGVVVYSLDQTTGALTQALAPLTSILFAPGATVADPMGPYIYSAQFTSPAVIHAYQVDQTTGNLAEISGSPFSSGLNPLGCCGGIALLGNPVQPVSGPAVIIFPSTADFSTVVGTTSSTQIFSVVNVGGQLLTINSISITGANASSFSQTNTCPASLAPNTNCSVSVNFSPATVGALTASLQVADNAAGSPQTLVLNGTGVAAAPAVTFSPSSLSFPSTNQGTSSPLQVLTVISSGNASLTVSSVSLTGPNAFDFSLTNNCTTAVAPGSNCTISLVFSPSASGQRSANLVLSDNAPDSPQTLVLSGTGIALLPALTLSPPVPSFSATTQGTSSAPQTQTITNSGNAPLQISSVSLGGSNPSAFTLTNNCSAAVAPGSNCTISLVFSPLASGQSTANLSITDNAPGSPQTVSLSATANPAFSVTAAPGSSVSASVSAGQTAQYQLQLTPGAGFAGTVSLSCSGAPLGAACQVPSSVSLANGAATTFTVAVTTGGSALLPPLARVPLPPTSAVPLLPLLALALALPLSFVGSRPFERFARKISLALSGLLCAVVFCSFLGIAGCGGGSSAVASPAAPPPIVTPSGTSTITISPSAMSSSGQPLQLPPILLTLTVK